MCGRIFQTLPLHRLLKIARAKCSPNSENHNISYNICPTTYIPAIKASRLYEDRETTEKEEKKETDEENDVDPNRELHFMKWGHSTQNNFVVNGRIEEMLQKRMFLEFIENRCVIILEGYYEWNQKKEPYCFKPKTGDNFLVAALYTNKDEVIILTKDAIPELKEVHHRMPVILSPEEVDSWLNPKNTKSLNQIIQLSLLDKNKPVWKNIGFAKLAPYVNAIKEKSDKCLMTAEDYKKELDSKGLMKYWGKKNDKKETIDENGKIKNIENVAYFESKEIEKKIMNEIKIEEKEKNKKESNEEVESD